MNYMFVLLVILISMLPLTSHSSESTVHPIDKAQKACIDKDSTTAGMTKCTNAAYQMWDKELNKNYNELMKRLSPQGKEALKSAQKEWLKYRDEEFLLIDRIYSELQGTMYIPIRAQDRLEIVKQRALQLQGYLIEIKNQ